MRPLLHLLITTMAAVALADEPAKTESAWQKLFRQHAADYRFTFADERKVDVTTEPIMFWSQPVRGGDDGLGGKQVWQVEKAKFDDSHTAYFCGTVERHREPPK
jgi:hypothetical protein